jgi:Cd2+/Zn2+-exporting ATPase
MSVKKEYVLQKLNCAVCAQKMEEKIQKIPGVLSAQVDFLGRNMLLELGQEKDEIRIIEEATKIIESIEAQVKVIPLDEEHEEEGHGHEGESKGPLIAMMVGAVIFASTYLPFFSDQLKLALYILSYGLIGWEVVLRAGKNILKGSIFDENFLMTLATLGAFAIKQYPEAVAVMLF